MPNFKTLFYAYDKKVEKVFLNHIFNYGVRNFALDSKDELMKILEITKGAKDLNLYVRISTSNEHAEIDLSRKFGASPSEALGLVRLCKEHIENRY